MSELPRLLRYESTYTSPHKVIDDMQLSSICAPAVTEVLCRPCGKANIGARQELFALMEQGDLYERMSSLLSDLNEYKRLLAILAQEKNKQKQLYINIRVLTQYCDIREKLASFVCDGELLSEVSEYCKEPISLRDDLSLISELLGSINSFFLSSSDKMWITPSADVSTYGDMILECAKELALTDGIIKRFRPFDIPACLSNSLFELYSDEFAKIYDIIHNYDSLNLDAFLSYIPELEFFTGVHALTKRADSYGIPHTIPKFSDREKFTARGLCDVTLLSKKVAAVPNDAFFTDAEPFFFLTGANGGGKTTYARAVGANLLLGLSGCPVFASEATVYPFSAVLTHFPSDERFSDIGRLDDEYRRACEMLSFGEGVPFLIFNETFSGTDDERGYNMLLETTNKIKELGFFGLSVTHFHEIEATDYPMLYAEVAEQDNNRRTYRIHRRGEPNTSYANDILKKYRIDRNSLKERLESV